MVFSNLLFYRWSRNGVIVLWCWPSFWWKTYTAKQETKYNQVTDQIQSKYVLYRQYQKNNADIFQQVALSLLDSFGPNTFEILMKSKLVGVCWGIKELVDGILHLWSDKLISPLLTNIKYTLCSTKLWIRNFWHIWWLFQTNFYFF